MKWISTMGACLLAVSLHAQVNRVTLQASGLTCSMCSNAIHKALLSLDAVDKVDANIKNSSFDITFKRGAVLNFDALKKEVEGAGFFVANLWVDMQLDNISVSNDTHIKLMGTMFHFLNVGDKKLNGMIRLRLLDKGFVTAREYKQNAKYTRKECYKTGMTGACCSDNHAAHSVRIYHVTI